MSKRGKPIQSLFQPEAKQAKINTPAGEAERKFVRVLVLQVIICAVIIAAILIIRFFSPDKYSYVIKGIGLINEENITLADLNSMLDRRVRENDTLSVFFNVEGVKDDKAAADK